MNKVEKEIAKVSLKAEDNTLKELQQIYKKARLDVQQKIADLNARTDMQNIQSIVYQKKYQQAILGQINEALADLRSGQYKTIEQYLIDSYDNGYIGMMYSLQSQGIPITMPIDERKVVQALTTDSKLVSRYYEANPLKGRLAEDVDLLKDRIRTNLSRGIVAGKSWVDVAVDLASGMNNPFDIAMHDAMRIVRTEGHRVNQQGFLDAGDIAKDTGADILKQWDATLDGRTRPWHQEADGQIVEWDEYFTVMGEKLKAPSIGGSARNVCNCRCQLLQRARWALDEDELKTLEERAKFFGLDKSESFEDYKQKYLKLPEKADTIKIEPEQKYFHDVSSTTTKLKKAMSDEDYQEYMKLVQTNPDIAPLYDMGDYLVDVRYESGNGEFFGRSIAFSYPIESDIKSGMSKYHTIAHEYGHFFDTRKYDDLTFSEHQSVMKAIKRAGKVGDASSSDQFLLAMRNDAKNIKQNFAEVVTYCKSHRLTSVGVQDAVDGLGYGRIYWGHGDRYYNRFYNKQVKPSNGWWDYSQRLKEVYTDLGFDASSQAKVKKISRQYETASELWANITSAVTTGGEELESLKKYFPEATEAFLEIIRKGAK
jgi:hypothetical protein